MKNLKDLLIGIEVLEVLGDADRNVYDLTLDSRKLVQAGMYIAVTGTRVDGHKFIPQAISNGATVICCQSVPEDIVEDVVYVCVENSRKAVSRLAANFYDHPSTQMKVIGVTGTNGKTSVATIGYQACKALGYKAGLLSTAAIWVDDEIYTPTHTTPDAISLQKWLAEMLESGCTWAWMEVSSHALDQNRADNVDFDIGVFTNITHDHLDYHGTFQNYIYAKKRLFDLLSKEAFAIINADDRNADVMVQNCKAKVVKYGMKTFADVQAKLLSQTFEGMQINVDAHELFTRLSGEYNASNLLAVYASMKQMIDDQQELLMALSNVKGAEGRLEKVFDQANKRFGIVDYAHTPDALEKVLVAVRGMIDKKNEVIAVVGCGGDRDATKRPIMARVAVKGSDKVVLTSDNPRSEDPDKIIEEMYEGVNETDRKKILKVTQRDQAINVAVSLAKVGDVVLVAGKGHEKYQEIKGKRIVFDDKQVLKEALG